MLIMNATVMHEASHLQAIEVAGESPGNVGVFYEWMKIWLNTFRATFRDDNAAIL